MNKVWITIIFISIGYGIFRGNIDIMVKNILEVPYKSLDLVIKIGGLIILYNGLFQIAIDAGIIKKISKMLMPLTSKLFKDIPLDNPSHEYISANLISNLLGLGIASQPMTIMALNEIKKLNGSKNELSKSMIRLLLLNISCFTIFPMTIISLRSIYDSKINIYVIVFIIIITLINTIISIILSKIFVR